MFLVENLLALYTSSMFCSQLTCWRRSHFQKLSKALLNNSGGKNSDFLNEKEKIGDTGKHSIYTHPL